MSNLLNTELQSEISEVRLMPKGERIAMSVVLQWSPDDYRIGARCKVQQLKIEKYYQFTLF